MRTMEDIAERGRGRGRLRIRGGGRVRGRGRAGRDVPGQRGGNITMCAAISSMHGVLHRHANLGPYNTGHILTFLDRLHNILIPPERMNDADHQRNRYVVVWDNVSFHRAAPVQNWFADHPTFLVQYLPPYSPFLNPIEELFRHGGGRYTTGSPLCACLLCRPWKRHVMRLMWVQFRDG